MADQAVLKELAPTGKLRFAIAVALPLPRNSPSRMGTAIEGSRPFGRALAAKLGVPQRSFHIRLPAIQILPTPIAGMLPSFRSVEDRKKFVAFGNAYHLLQSTFLVAPASKINSVKDADAKGVGIGGVANTATFRAAKKATSNATHIDFAGVDAAVAAMLDGRIEAIALSRESLSGLVGKITGSRILNDAFLNSSTAVCVPKGKPAALAYVSDFIEGAKASGLVRKALDEMGLKSSQVAPTGMKP
jgi:polar amino acid transport system substrate-binding protein